MPSPVQFDSVADGRAHLKELLDAAAAGIPAELRRDRDHFAVVDAGRLRHSLASLCRRAEVLAEADGWSVFVPGIPVAADADTLGRGVQKLLEMSSAFRDAVELNRAGHSALLALFF